MQFRIMREIAQHIMQAGYKFYNDVQNDSSEKNYTLDKQ